MARQLREDPEGLVLCGGCKTFLSLKGSHLFWSSFDVCLSLFARKSYVFPKPIGIVVFQHISFFQYLFYDIMFDNHSMKTCELFATSDPASQKQ